MKAIIIAAGKGNRLNPITEHTPKCMLDIEDFKTRCFGSK